jgi:hypothetical protein
VSEVPEGLTVAVPGAKQPTPLPTADLLHTFLAIETGDDASLSPASRRQVELVQGLQAKGYKFFNRQTEDELTTRSGAVLTLHTPDHNLTMRAPGGERRTPIREDVVLEHLTHLENGQANQLPSELAESVALYPQLQAGTTMQMEDIKDKSKWVSCGPAEMLACLSQNRPVGLLNSAYDKPVADASPSRTVVTGPAEFLAAARRRIAGSTPDDAQQSTLNGLQTLLAQGASGRVDGTNRNVATAALLPWLMNDQSVVHIHSAADSSGSVRVSNWNELTRLVDVEAGRDTQTNAAAVADGRLVASLRNHNLKFYTVNANKKTPPLGLKTAVVDQMQHGGVQVRTPRLIWWGAFPCFKVTVKSTADLEKLHKKFPDQVQTLFSAV